MRSGQRVQRGGEPNHMSPMRLLHWAPLWKLWPLEIVTKDTIISPDAPSVFNVHNEKFIVKFRGIFFKKIMKKCFWGGAD